jgi:bifunctional non-homologous end joining protein LigD
LWYIGGGSDKVYHIFLLEKDKNAFVVNVQYGRRGGTMAAGTKTNTAVSLAEAKRIFRRTYDEKFKKGYRPLEGTAAQPITPVMKEPTGVMPQLLNLIDDEELAKVLRNSTHWMQEKKDGVWLIVEWMPNAVRGINRSGEAVAVPAEISQAIQGLCVHAGLQGATLFDGELVGMSYYPFDLLTLDAQDYRSMPFAERYQSLVSLLGNSFESQHIEIVPCYHQPQDKGRHFDLLKGEGVEGVVFKRRDSLYVAGRPNSGGDQLKYKFWATGDFVVTRVNQKRSVAVHAVDAQSNEVALGNVTVPRNYVLPQAGDVVQVRYLYAYRDGCLYQPQYEGVRDDKRAAECLMTQLKYKGEGSEEEGDA